MSFRVFYILETGLGKQAHRPPQARTPCYEPCALDCSPGSGVDACVDVGVRDAVVVIVIVVVVVVVRLVIVSWR